MQAMITKSVESALYLSGGFIPFSASVSDIVTPVQHQQDRQQNVSTYI